MWDDDDGEAEVLGSCCPFHFLICTSIPLDIMFTSALEPGESARDIFRDTAKASRFWINYPKLL